MFGNFAKTLQAVRFLLSGFLLISLLFLSPSASGQHRFLENGTPGYVGPDGGISPGSPTRVVIDLAGSWGYSVEGGGRGQVRVPSSTDFTGTVTFERSVELTDEQIAAYDFELVVLGANYASEVHVNGEYIGNHMGGYTSYSLPIPPGRLRAGRGNDIRVEVDNALDPRRTVPPRTFALGWRNYGGILRDIYLLGVPRLALRDVAVSSSVAPGRGSATIAVRASVRGASPSDAAGKAFGPPGVILEVVEKLSGSLVARSPVQRVSRDDDGNGLLQVSVPLTSPRLWSPESPDLYLVKCLLVAESRGRDTVLDEFHQNHGLRAIELSGGGVMVNGRRTTLRGMVWNEDHSAYGAALTYAEMEKDVVLMKNLGANVVRFGHHPPHPYMLNLCDRYGLLALVELPLPGVPSTVLAEDVITETASAMLREMIARDRHHPSLLAWGLGDDLDVTSTTTREFLEPLASLARSLDGRPLYYGSRALKNDVCADLVDVILLHSTAADAKDFRRELEEWKRLHPGRPVVVGKMGTEVQPDNRNGYSDPLSYEAQARFFLQRLEAAKSAGVDGVILTAFNDWKTDRPSLMVRSGDPWIVTMGLVGQQREKRLAYDAVRAAFRGEKFAAIPIGGHSSNAPIVYVVVGLVVLLGVAYVYNASRRFRDSLVRSSFNAFNFFTDARDQRMVSVLQSVLLAVAAALGLAVVVSSLLYRFRTHWVLDNLLSHLTVYDNVKEQVIRIVWDPLTSILAVTAIVLAAQVLLWLLLLALGPFLRTRLSAYNAFVLVTWPAAPLLLLVPVGMIVYRITESSVYVLPALLLPLLLLGWTALRLLKGLAVMTDGSRARTTVVGVLLIVAVLFAAGLALDQAGAASAHVASMVRIVTNAR